MTTTPDREILGIVYPPSFEPEGLPAYARAAERAGVEELWLWEDCFREGGVATVAAALAVTERIRVAIGVFPMPLRNIAMVAMETASLVRMFPGRFVLGIGHGVQRWMEQIGARAASPLTLMREYVPALRALLAGEEVTVSGRYINLDKVKLDWPPTEEIEILIGGEGPKTLVVTGELGDGTIFVPGISPKVIAEAAVRIDEGRVNAGRTSPRRISVFIMTVFADTPEGLEQGRAWFQEEWDREERPEADRGGLIGTPAEIVEQLRAYREAGVTNPVLLPAPWADREAFLAGAGEVTALLR